MVWEGKATAKALASTYDEKVRLDAKAVPWAEEQLMHEPLTPDGEPEPETWITAPRPMIGTALKTRAVTPARRPVADERRGFMPNSQLPIIPAPQTPRAPLTPRRPR